MTAVRIDAFTSSTPGLRVDRDARIVEVPNPALKKGALIASLAALRRNESNRSILSG
jgi:hypothetical protein